MNRRRFDDALYTAVAVRSNAGVDEKERDAIRFEWRMPLNQ